MTEQTQIKQQPHVHTFELTIGSKVELDGSEKVSYQAKNFATDEEMTFDSAESLMAYIIDMVELVEAFDDV